MSMKRWGPIVVWGILGLGFLGYWIFFRNSCAVSSPKASPLTASMNWKVFQAEDPPFNFSFEYPSSWKASTSRFTGEFDMISIMGPHEDKTKFTASFYIVKKTAAGKRKEQLADDILKEKEELTGFKLLGRKNQKTPSGSMLDVEYQYDSKLPLYAPQRYDAVIQTKELFFIKGDFLYRFSFNGTQEQYKIFLPFFEHLVNTFRFKD